MKFLDITLLFADNHSFPITVKFTPTKSTNCSSSETGVRRRNPVDTYCSESPDSGERKRRTGDTGYRKWIGRWSLRGSCDVGCTTDRPDRCHFLRRMAKRLLFLCSTLEYCHWTLHQCSAANETTSSYYYCPSFLLSLPTCVMYYIGCLSLSGYNIVLLCWFPGVSFAVPPLTFVISAAQCRFRQRVGCSVLQRGTSSWSLSLKSFFFGRDWAGSASE